MGLFTPKSVKERREKRERARAIGEAKRASSTVEARVNSLAMEREKSWDNARKYLANGQKAAAQRMLLNVRQIDSRIQSLQKRIWSFDNYISKLEMAETDNSFAGVLSKLNNVLKINPAKVDAVIGQTNDLLANQNDVDEIWNASYNAEMESLALNDEIPSMEQMMSDLETEIGGTIAPILTTPAVADENIPAAINSKRDRLQSLVDDK